MYISLEEIVKVAVEKAFRLSQKKYQLSAQEVRGNEDLKDFLRWWYKQRPDYEKSLKRYLSSNIVRSAGFPLNVAADAMFVYAVLSGKVQSDKRVEKLKSRVYHRNAGKLILDSLRFTFEGLVAEVAKYNKVDPDSTKILTPYDVINLNRSESEIFQFGIDHVIKLSSKKYSIRLSDQTCTGITNFMNWFFEHEPLYKSLFISSFDGVIFPNWGWPVNFFQDLVLLYAVLGGRAAISAKEHGNVVTKTIDSAADLKYLRPVSLDNNTLKVYYNCGYVYPRKVRNGNVPYLPYQKLVELIGSYDEIKQRFGKQIVYEEDVGKVNGDRSPKTTKKYVAKPEGEIGPANDVASLVRTRWSPRFDPGYELVMRYSSDQSIVLKLNEHVRSQLFRQIETDIWGAIENTLKGLGLNDRISLSIEVDTSGIVRLSYNPHGEGNYADTMSFLHAYAKKVVQTS